MLLELKKYWIDKWYFLEKRLNELSEAEKDWFEKLENKIIDFDETWKKFPKFICKTADVLKFDNANNLRFIEFKNIEDSVYVEDFIKNLFFTLKVQESFQLLRNIINEIILWIDVFWTKERRNKFNKTKNIFIFSIAGNLNPKISLLLDLETAWLEDYEKTLEKVIWIETKDLQNYL
jgi:hypothetical protein